MFVYVFVSTLAVLAVYFRMRNEVNHHRNIAEDEKARSEARRKAMNALMDANNVQIELLQEEIQRLQSRMEQSLSLRESRRFPIVEDTATDMEIEYWASAQDMDLGDF